MLTRRGFALPAPLKRVIADESQRPLMATLFYSHGAMRFRPLVGVMPFFARAFFDLFGTAQG